VSPKPSNAIGTFGGRLAKTADQPALARAEDMTARGVPREQVWNDTGWFRGVDGKWRFEIDDSQADFTGLPKNSETDTFGSMVRHPELLTAYPDMAPMSFVAPNSSGGNYSPATFSKFEGRVIPESMSVGRAQENAQPFSVALHESQHALQHREGFETGGAARGSEAEIYNRYAAKINNAIQDGDKQEAARLRNDLKALNLRGDIDTYKRLAGEVEARAVQTRMDMTPDQRRARPPWLDYDVPEDQQIVRGVVNALLQNYYGDRQR
jgi:hypothetical protein